MNHRSRAACTIALLAALAGGCSDEDTGTGPDPAVPPFLAGTVDDPQIGIVVASLGRTLTMFHLAAPDERRTIPLGASSSVTPVGLSVRGTRILVPLGNAASVAVVDAATERVERFFLFPGGNTSGSAWVDDSTALVSNLVTDIVGRIRLDQVGDAIQESVAVAPAPADVVVTGDRAFVVSGNLGDDFLPLGNGVVTALDPDNLEILDTIGTGGANPQYAAVGPDGLLYVVNTGDFVGPGTMAIIDPVALERVGLVEGMGVGPGAITIDARGLAYISGFFFGTIVFDTKTRSFVRGPDDPVCAPIAAGGCRGAFHARADNDGDLYQAFFGSPGEGLASFTFVYQAGNFALTDSIESGLGPASIEIRTFAN